MQLQSPSRQIIRDNACGFAVFALTVATFSPLLTCGFTSWDDLLTIVHNWRLSDPLYFWSHPYMDLYVPVTYTLWSLIAAISTSAWIFHLVNILIHATNALIVYQITKQLTKAHGWLSVGFIGALIFALHPLQVETVAWVSGTKDLLCGLFVLLTIYLYLRNKYWLATIALILGMLSKPTAVVAPFMVLVIDTLIIKRPLRETAKRLAPWFILIIPCLYWTHRFQVPTTVQTQPLLRPLIALDAISFYIYKLIFPVNLAVDYGRNPAYVISSGAIYYTWIVPVVVAILCYRKLPWLLLFVIPLLPVLGLVPFDFQTYSTVADHYLYLSLASVGLAIGSIETVRLRKSRGASPAAKWGFLILVPLGVLSVLQMRYWRDTQKLFEHALDVNPRSYAALDSLAANALEKQDLIAVESYSNRALSIHPRDVAARVHLADALVKKGDLAGAMKLLRQAKGVEPDSPEVAVNLSGLLAQMNDPQAEAELRRALQLAPDNASAYLNLGTFLVANNRIEESLPYLQRAVAMRADDARAHTNLGIAYASVGRNAEAIDQLEQALKIDPNFSAARETLASLRR